MENLVLTEEGRKDIVVFLSMCGEKDSGGFYAIKKFLPSFRHQTASDRQNMIICAYIVCFGGKNG